ncbi:histidinol-phosphatase [Spirosoma taeanense]|uniref:protein-tyrosine-phosphatase n=1 Tax=Spirosoma taeanense TaxID=2735870 RepID=A0A6M5Y702_9BACT|nr:CpsB/CapC family capsule biosynthesis tyrosine phosphatase [Spirosoma taeanense]QJW88492.1 histidinol-phosphatase [Spirosoma taeanense]
MHFWQTIRRAINSFSTPTTVDMTEPCYWRVDMHSHLIPGIDDGVTNPDQAVLCLKQLAAWGIQKVITTPHVSRDWYPNTSAGLRAGQATLQALADEHAPGLQIEVAAEYLLDEFFPAMIDTDELLTFGSARYLLFELGWAAAPHQLDELLFRLRTRGYTPVLAHPERYVYYYDDPTPLIHLHETGCLFQLNWASLTGRYGERAQIQARMLLKKGWVDFIGSDLHRPGDLSALSALFSSPEYEQLRKQPLLNESLG